jgi:beta-glucosidase
MSFPKDFVWGAAAASYQVEGGAYEDGKGLSVWDIFCRQPGKIWEGNTGDIASDHYHRYLEDASLMGEIGLKAYRLSISWPRVLPDGIGKINEKGLAFYDRLVDSLLENNVQPWITLFHWDYPYELYKRGGWLNPDSSDWFAEYTKVVVDKLSDRVSHWMTLNEPQVFIDAGHRESRHAPGLELGYPDLLTIAHNSLLAHGKAVQVIRASARSDAVVGAALVGATMIPATDNAEDIEAARSKMFSVRDKIFMNNSWFSDPMILGNYPVDGLELFGRDMPEFPNTDMNIICQPLDFYGVNIYQGEFIQATPDGGAEVTTGTDIPALTTMGWPITPQALYWGPRFLYERYNLPIVITENGIANMDWVHRDGKVHDPQRIDYLGRHLSELRRAIDDNVAVKGYFVWSIMDNFEWAHGYKQRFGLIYVDYSTGQRIMKDSAYWYKEVIATNGESISG